MPLSFPTTARLLLGSALVASLLATQTLAATPASGTISATSGAQTWGGGPFFVSNQSSTAVAPICNAALGCDDYLLTASFPVATPGASIRVSVSWTSPVAEFDLYVLDATGTVVSQAGNSASPNSVLVPATNGVYTVRVIPYQVAGDSYTALAAFVPAGAPPPAFTGTAPRYATYAAPNGLGTSAGEPSLGVNWSTGAVLYLASLETMKVTFDDSTSPAQATWKDVPSQITSVTTLDPILFTDHRTNRTFVSQLAAAAGSLTAYTDDDGTTYTPSQGAGQPAGVDHQTLGGGPYTTTGTVPAPPHPLYADSVYYCSQDLVTATCSRSDNGGLTFGPAVPIYNLTQCGGIHGHLMVAPDGTTYVPNMSCAGHQAVIVSEDNGITWAVRPVSTSTTPKGAIVDPAVALGANNTVYFGYQAGDGHPHTAVSHDAGKTWGNDTDVGFTLGLQNATFPAMAAGDDDRAAFAFLGTPTAGAYTDPVTFKTAEWHLYLAHTYDGGRTWVTVDATPSDPVQRGSICNLGTTGCANNAAGGADRNLLDFITPSVDARGRVLVAFADGCIGACVNGLPNSYSALASIARQSGGKTLFARFDPVEPGLPQAPLLATSPPQDSAGVHLSWSTPDNGGSAITGYTVYRGTTAGGETVLANLGVRTSYVDSTAKTGTFYYRVSASNAVGQGPLSNEVTPVPAPPPADPCHTPGVTVVSQAPGSQTGAPANAQLDVTSISIAEPYFPDGSNKLVFTMKVENLSPQPLPNQSWKVNFKTLDGVSRFVAMSTGAAGATPPSAAPVTFTYGHTSVGTGGVNMETTDGNADAASTFNTDGTITIVVANAGIGNPAAGQSLGAISGLTQQLVGVLLLRIDTTPVGSYTLVGNYYCRPNHPPVAALTANPSSGYAPLAVKLDGSASSDVDGDGIASYTFDFGDGSPTVSQTAPTISHTYATVGKFTASLTVVDGRGLAGTRPATVTITTLAPPGGGGGGGTCTDAQSHKARGSGYLGDDEDAKFKYDADCTPEGHMSYEDDKADFAFDSDKVDSFSRAGSCVNFGGPAVTSHGKNIRYAVKACDNGNPGRGHDTFSITVTGDVSYARSGTVTAGDEQADAHDN